MKRGRAYAAVGDRAADPGPAVVWFPSLESLDTFGPRERWPGSAMMRRRRLRLGHEERRARELGRRLLRGPSADLPGLPGRSVGGGRRDGRAPTRAADEPPGLTHATRPRGATDDVVVEDRDSLTSIPHILFGGDYNPEQWPEETWREDARAHAGGRRQPGLARDLRLGQDRAGARASTTSPGSTGSSTCSMRTASSINLATPTASPPPWLVRRHPEILPGDRRRARLWHGSRRHYCPHSPAYRERAAARRPGPGGALPRPSGRRHVARRQRVRLPRDECFCDASAAAFRELAPASVTTRSSG